MIRKAVLFVVVMMICNSAFADEKITKEKLKSISQEFSAALKEGDFSVVEKYMHPSSKIIIDLDPANNQGEKELSYEEFMKIAKLGFEMMQNADVFDELISISIDTDNNQGTIEEKTTAVVEMVGMKIEDVSINKTTYGYIDGKIKVLVAEEQLISSGPIQ